VLHNKLDDSGWILIAAWFPLAFLHWSGLSAVRSEHHIRFVTWLREGYTDHRMDDMQKFRPS
jgi:hypothetical protein